MQEEFYFCLNYVPYGAKTGKSERGNEKLEKERRKRKKKKIKRLKFRAGSEGRIQSIKGTKTRAPNLGGPQNDQFGKGVKWGLKMTS